MVLFPPSLPALWNQAKPKPCFARNESHFRFYLVLSTMQSEKSQAYKMLTKQSQYGLTCLAKAVLQFLISGAPSDAVTFGTHSSDYWRRVTDSSGTSFSVLLMIPGRKFFMINTVVTVNSLRNEQLHYSGVVQPGGKVRNSQHAVAVYPAGMTSPS